MEHLQCTAGLEWGQIGPGQGAEVHVGALVDPVAATSSLARGRHHQRHPGGQFAWIFTPLHGGECRQFTELAMALAQKGDVVVAPHRTQMGHLM